MLTYYKYIFTFLFLITFSMTVTVPVAFGQTYTLTIQEGRVLINGKQLEEDQIPNSLDVENVYVSLSFSGTMTPTFELNGRYYTLDGQSLREVRRSDFPDDETTVVFRNNAAPTEPAAKAGEQVGDYASRLDQQYPYAPPSTTAQVADYNRLMEQYVMEMSKRDQALYRQLITELELERETQEIAAQARALPPGEERDQQIAQLRRLLGQAFDLKQENRQREIEQIEQQLEVLQKRLADREAMKDRIIDHRINELVGSLR